jgi:DNA-binding transcriptional regulator YbjK
LRQAALSVAIEFGVKGVTHRRVAAAAGVALGSASYHYEHIDELMLEAFTWWVETQNASFAPALEAAETDEDILAAVMNLLSVIHGSENARILLFEIYAQSVRDPAYHKLVEQWSRQTRDRLERLYSPRTAQQIEAVWEGIGVQFVMGTIDSLDEVEPLVRLVLTQESASPGAKTTNGRKRSKGGPKSVGAAAR